MSEAGPGPKDVIITRADKRGEWHTVEGIVNGKKVTAHIPAPSIDGKPRKDAEALMRRSLYGTSRMPAEGECKI